MGELLIIDHLSYTYPSQAEETPVLDDVSFSVKDSEIVAIVGPSGCGKSTLLSLIAGLLTPTSGSVIINGTTMTSSGKSIGYILQKEHLFDYPNAYRHEAINYELPYPLSGSSYVQINELLNTYGVVTFPNSFPFTLPEGVRQRTNLLRSLLQEQDLLLLDEPFSSLEETLRVSIYDDVWKIIRDEKKTVILVTSSLLDAVSIADKIIILSKPPQVVIKIIELPAAIRKHLPSKVRESSKALEYLTLLKELIQTQED